MTITYHHIISTVHCYYAWYIITSCCLAINLPVGKQNPFIAFMHLKYIRDTFLFTTIICNFYNFIIVLQISQLWENWVSSIIDASLLFLQKKYFSAPNHERQMFLFFKLSSCFPVCLVFSLLVKSYEHFCSTISDSKSNCCLFQIWPVKSHNDIYFVFCWLKINKTSWVSQQ